MSSIAIAAISITFIAMQITMTIAQPPPPGECPTGWTIRDRGSCYLVVIGATPFQNGRTLCRNLGADMVSLQSRAEGQFVDALARNSGVATYWIGLQKVGRGWIWVDGSPLTFTNWRGREPDGCCGPNVTCAIAGYRQGFNGQWDDTSCNRIPPRLQGYVCEIGPR